MLVKGGDNGKIKMPDFMKSSVAKINEFVQSAIGFIYNNVLNVLYYSTYAI